METLQIYLIERVDHIGYDECVSHVIAAQSKNECRTIAYNESCDENPAVWKDAKIDVIGIYTGDKKESHIILTDFNNG